MWRNLHYPTFKEQLLSLFSKNSHHLHVSHCKNCKDTSSTLRAAQSLNPVLRRKIVIHCRTLVDSLRQISSSNIIQAASTKTSHDVTTVSAAVHCGGLGLNIATLATPPYNCLVLAAPLIKIAVGPVLLLSCKPCRKPLPFVCCSPIRC